MTPFFVCLNSSFTPFQLSLIADIHWILTDTVLKARLFPKTLWGKKYYFSISGWGTAANWVQCLVLSQLWQLVSSALSFYLSLSDTVEKAEVCRIYMKGGCGDSSICTARGGLGRAARLKSYWRQVTLSSPLADLTAFIFSIASFVQMSSHLSLLSKFQA